MGERYYSPERHKNIETSMEYNRIKKYYDKIKEVYGDLDTPDSTEFAEENIIDKNEIEKDQKRVEEIKDKFSKKLEKIRREDPEKAIKIETRKILSDIMEIYISNFCEVGKWFGENSFAFKTNEFDDLINGTDLVIFVDDAEEPLAISIDVTSAIDSYTLEEKLTKCDNKFFPNNHSEIKYATLPPDGNQKCSLETSVPVVVGFGTELTNDLTKMLYDATVLDEKKNKNRIEKNKLNELNSELKNHAIQINILEQILSQIEYYSLKLNKSQPNNHYLDKLFELSDNLSKVLKEKEKKGYQEVDDPTGRLIKNKIGRRKERVKNKK